MNKPIIFAGVAAVVLLAVSYFFVLPMMKGKPAKAVEDDDEPVAAAQVKKKKAKRPAEPGLMYPMAERVLNLASSGGAPHYARIELAVEFEKPKEPARPAKKAEAKGEKGKDAGPPLDPALEPVAERKALIDDALVRILGTKSVEGMTSAEGREALKQEMLAAVEAIVPEPAPLAVYIVRLIVQ